MKEILNYLKMNGEQIDTVIADATGIPLAEAHLHLSELAAKGIIVACHSIRYENGNKIEGIVCRIAGYVHPVKPTRVKSKPQLEMCR